MSTAPPDRHRWVVCQLGARMHYAVPRLLAEAGMLERFYTDVYASDRLAAFMNRLPEKWRTAGLRRLMGRVATHMPQDKVWSHPTFGVIYYLRRSLTSDLEKMSAVHLWAGNRFGRFVTRRGFGSATAVYTYNTAALEILHAARARGLFTVVEQTIAPRAIEEDLLAEEQRRYPDWEQPRTQGPAARRTAIREQQEWALADLIVCGSDFVKEGIARCGGPVEKCVVVPYGVDAQFDVENRAAHDGPLRILTVGEVGLRKGASYCLETAVALAPHAEFRWVGPSALKPAALARLSQSVDMTGVVPRTRILPHYEWADVFFLPSVCEGSATVTYEALACGLPVVTTPNAGSTVRNGETGFVVPVRDVPAMVARLRQLHEDRALLARMSWAATAHFKDVSLAAYQERLLGLLGSHGKTFRPPAKPAHHPGGQTGRAPWICCQVGAREHYSVARSIHRHGRLAGLITEAWIEPGRHLGRLHPRLEQRYHPDLAHAPVHAFNLRTLLFESFLRVAIHHPWRRVQFRNAFFQRRALASLRGMETALKAKPVLFAYSYAALELLRFARSRGWPTVLGQIDPGPPGDPPPVWDEPQAPPSYWANWRNECALADAIIVNSEWSRECLVREGIPAGKLQLIPLAYEAMSRREPLAKTYPRQFDAQRPMNVLLLGKLNRRKGVPEVFDAIRLLREEPIAFHFTGDREVAVPADLRRDPRIRWQGSITRHAVDECYREADVFLFPSHSDGFGLTQLEAQSWRVPVIASRHCGSVVRDDVNGQLLPEVTGESIAHALRQCVRSPKTLAAWSAESGVDAQFSVESIGSEMLQLGEELCRSPEQMDARRSGPHGRP